MHIHVSQPLTQQLVFKEVFLSLSSNIFHFSEVVEINILSSSPIHSISFPFYRHSIEIKMKSRSVGNYLNSNHLQLLWTAHVVVRAQLTAQPTADHAAEEISNVLSN